MIRKKITENKKERIDFGKFIEWLKIFVVKFCFLIFTISIFNLFLGINFDIDYKKKIQVCNECEDVKSEAKSLLGIIYSYNREGLQHENFQSDINDINESDEINTKEISIEKIEKWLVSTKLNINNLNLYFDKENNVWKENYLLSLSKNDPVKSLIIHPLNIVSENIEKIFSRKRLNNSEFFFLDIFVKLVLCNLFIYLLVENIDDNFPFPNINENMKKLEDQKLENVNLEELQKNITKIFFDIFVFIFFGIFIIQNKSLLNREIPKKIREIKGTWWIMSEVFLVAIIPLIMKKFFFERNKNEEEKNPFFEIFANIFLKTLLIWFGVFDINLQFKWFINMIVVELLKFFAHVLKFLKIKEESPL